MTCRRFNKVWRKCALFRLEENVSWVMVRGARTTMPIKSVKNSVFLQFVWVTFQNVGCSLKKTCFNQIFYCSDFSRSIQCTYMSENSFGRKLSFKLCETWYFWGVKLGYINYIVFVYPTLSRPPKTYVAEIWSWIKTRHFSPLLTGLCFWLKRGPSTASTPAW